MTGNYSKIPKYFTTKKVLKGVKVANEELSDEPEVEVGEISEDHEDQPKPTKRGKKRLEKYRIYKLFFEYGRSDVKLHQKQV